MILTVTSLWLLFCLASPADPVDRAAWESFRSRKGVIMRQPRTVRRVYASPYADRS